MPLPKELLEIETRKWRKECEKVADRWAEALKEAPDRWAEMLSKKTGVPVKDIKAGPMYKEYKKFAEEIVKDPSSYIQRYKRGVKKADDKDKWAKNFYKALVGKEV